MSVKAEVKKLKENIIELNVSVSAEKFKSAVAKTYKEIAKKAKIPGFRAGKIPAKVIDGYYGKEYVLHQAVEDSLPDFYSEAVHESGIKPIDTPKVEIVSMEENTELKFKAEVEVEPELILADYKDIKVKFDKAKVKDDEVQTQIDVIKNRFAELEPAEGKIAEKADHLLINFDGTIDGKPFEGGSAQNFMLELGSKTLIEEFETQLIGSKAGDIKMVDVILPEYPDNKEIAGKNAQFKVLVKEIKVKKLPELTDRFVKENTGVENKSALEKDIRKDLQDALDKHTDNQYQQVILKELAQKSNVKIPEKMVDMTVDEMMHEFEHSLKNQGSTLEHYLETTKSSIDDMKKSLRESAEERARQELTFKAFIEKEKIEVTEEDIDKVIAESNPKHEKPLSRKELEEKGLMSYLKSNVLYKKALEALVKKVSK